MPTIRLTIRNASIPAEMDTVRTLCWDYRTYLCAIGPEECAAIETLYPEPDYSALMDRLEHEHAPGKGAILVAEIDGRIVGCGMIREIAPRIGEIKRVFVCDAARGMDAGHQLCLALLECARTLGHELVRLDTLKTLKAAKNLYCKLGFIQRGPYADIPEVARDMVCFYEIAL
ncbi:MAG: GNAT family N-acetyltransferase [Paracoccaceae bacterium]